MLTREFERLFVAFCMNAQEHAGRQCSSPEQSVLLHACKWEKWVGKKKKKVIRGTD